MTMAESYAFAKVGLLFFPSLYFESVTWAGKCCTLMVRAAAG
jgi:hypothetical protein